MSSKKQREVHDWFLKAVEESFRKHNIEIPEVSRQAIEDYKKWMKKQQRMKRWFFIIEATILIGAFVFAFFVL
jgi:hypothetical protein